MIAKLAARLVDFSRRYAVLVTTATLLLCVGAGWYAAGHLAMDSNVQHLLPSDPSWRQQEIALDHAFPQHADLLAVVIDARSSELAGAASRELAKRLRAAPQLFRDVRTPDGGPFFEQNGILFLLVDKLTSISEQLIAAQPLLGSLAQDPSLRGLFDTLTVFVKAANEGQTTIADLNPTLATIADGVDSALAGKTEPLSWQLLMTGEKPDPRELRRFVLTRPVLDYSSLEPGAYATGKIRRIARELGFSLESGVRLRITGPVALDDEQFATLQEGALKSTILSLVSVCVILFAAVRSVRLVLAILTTLIAGLVLTGGFAALAIGSLNLISVAFAVLFVGLAVDFSIQFSVRYRDERHRSDDLATALRNAALTIGPSLLLAAGATAIGFLAFVPTRYIGVRELGIIAGVGMIIAIILNFVFLPGLMALLRPGGEAEAIGFRRAAALDRLLIVQRRSILIAIAILAIGSLSLAPRIVFDFDPLNLKDKHSESVATALDLMSDATTSPYRVQVLAPSLKAAQELSDRLEKLPQVAQVVGISSFIPEDQDAKLAILEDLALLLGPSLTPPTVLPAPNEEQVLAALATARDALAANAAASGPDVPAARLQKSLGEAIGRGPAIIPVLRQVLLTGLLQRVDALKTMIEAKPVTFDSLPAELRGDWVTSDGRARLEVFPRGDARDSAVLEQFVAAVRTVAPDVTGAAVTIQESGRLISGAFVQAGIIAVIVITALLIAVLRNLREVALVIAPLLLSAALTLAITVLIGMKLNYANIIALPLLLGIGVAFDIYFVMNWRAGITHHLQSSTARAVVFSALTTMTAFGSLALSKDPGTAGMGTMLSLSLACTLFCTLIVLPTLLGPAPRARFQAVCDKAP